MRRTVSALIATMTLLFAGSALAQTNQVVVELYTSQGCSSCPPADKILHKLAARDDVIALALHVDYWDYIGWKDTFADPKYTKRQRAYAQAANSRSIYTPQMVIGGISHVIGNHPMEVVEAVEALRNKNTGVKLDVVRNGDRLSIDANLTRGKGQAMQVQLVRYTPLSSVAIRRGENAGRTIEYNNIVTQWDQIKKWNGSSALDMTVNVSGTDPVVVIVQAANNGPILAAVQLR